MPNPLPGTVLLAEGEVRSVEVPVGPVASGPCSPFSVELAEPWASLPEPFVTVLDRLAADTVEEDCSRRCFNCGAPVGFVLEDDDGRRGMVWQPLWMLAGPDDQVTVVCEDCAEPFPIDAPVTVPETGESPATVQVKVITCPRAESTMTPCVARDGHAAAAFEGSCISCEHSPADLLRDLVREYVEVQERLRDDNGLTEAVQLATALLRKAGGRVEVTPADLEAVDGTLHREDRPDGTVVLTLSSVAEPSPS